MATTNLKPGEMVCNKCDGRCYLPIENTISGYRKCSKCFGAGKLDWIENIVGKSTVVLVVNESDLVNKNGRIYPKDVMKKAVEKYEADIKSW